MTGPSATEADEKPGFLDRMRARMPWFDHVMRAQDRYASSKGDFYAAGITYFTIFALFPLLMVGFAVGGFVLASRPDLIVEIEDQIRANVSGDLGQQLVELMESAIESRATVGIIGLATAAWAGLGWMNNLREALSQMWGLYRDELPGFVKKKLSDLTALVSLFLASVLTLALTALGNTTVIQDILMWFGFPDSTALSVLLRVASIAISILVSWLLFTYVTARVGQSAQQHARRADRRGRVRDLQAGRFDLPEVGADRSGGRDVRSGAGPDGLRLHHCTAGAVLDGMGGDAAGEHGGGAGPGARAGGHQQPHHPPPRPSPVAGRCRRRRGSGWCAEPFPVAAAVAVSAAGAG